MSDDESENSRVIDAIVLDYLPHGRMDDDRPRYQKRPLAHALGSEHFELFELVLVENADVNIGDRVSVERSNDVIDAIRTIGYDELSSGARSELEYVVRDLIASNEQRFVDVYNEAQPITLRLHQLNLLPGIGEKLRNTILDERKRNPFESFADLEERVSGLHNPEDILVDRILEELQNEDLKYRMVVKRTHQ